MQFSLEKRLEKRKWIHATRDSTSRWITYLFHSLIDSSILQEIFYLSQNVNQGWKKKQVRRMGSSSQPPSYSLTKIGTVITPSYNIG